MAIWRYVFAQAERFTPGQNLPTIWRELKTNDRDDRVLYRLARENRRFSVQRLRRAWQPNVNFALSGQTVNRVVGVPTGLGEW